MRLQFNRVEPHHQFNGTSTEPLWNSWIWQMQNRLTDLNDFEKVFKLSPEEKRGFEVSAEVFKISTTPYYASLAAQYPVLKPIFMPLGEENNGGVQAMLDPLGEVRHSAGPRVIHRYSDRVLFLVTDTCSVYCRFCTRKRFTGSDQGFLNSKDYEQSLEYIKSHPGIREVILSGGDPLTLSDSNLERILSDLRSIEHVEIIRLGSRMPVVCPTRVDEKFAKMMRKYAPVFMMTHFNHPKELTYEAAQSLTHLVDNGIPVFNQSVLINGVNNHVNIVQALNRRLLYLRVKPYYLFQCDPSEGTDHLRTSIEEGEKIVKEMWGHFSGLAMSNFAVDIPDGGGKTVLTPDFMIEKTSHMRVYKGWDGKVSEYINPVHAPALPLDFKDYQNEWDETKNAKSVSIGTEVVGKSAEL